MTITQLEYVVAVATYKSFVSAAEKCFVTQPTLSMQIQKLEEELGDSNVDFGTLAATAGLEEAPIVKLLQSVFDDAIQIRASDIHIEPYENRMTVRFRIDGVFRHERIVVAAGREVHGMTLPLSTRRGTGHPWPR